MICGLQISDLILYIFKGAINFCHAFQDEILILIHRLACVCEGLVRSLQVLSTLIALTPQVIVGTGPNTNRISSISTCRGWRNEAMLKAERILCWLCLRQGFMDVLLSMCSHFNQGP